MNSAKGKLVLQKRDLDLLVGLFESRVMTSAHASTLHFGDRRETAKKRLQKLKAAGLISERRQIQHEAALLFLSSAGIALLHRRGLLAPYPALSSKTLEKRARVSALTIKHELEVMDVKAAVHSALHGDPTFTVAEFCTWPRLHEFESASRNGSSTFVRPDGFIRIHEKEPDGGVSEHTFFLEVDRSTEAQDVLVARANAYLDFYRSGGFAVQSGGEPTAFREYPFRVLFVLKTAERRNNTALRLLHQHPPILSHVWLSTLDEVKSNPVGPIWVRPMDYRDVTTDTPFGPSIGGYGYRRHSAREAFIESKLSKQRLLH